MSCFLFQNIQVYYEYESFNNSIPTVFLHGWGANSQVFKEFINDLKEKKYSYLIIDFPPFGNSGNLINTWTLFEYSNLILELIKKLNINKVNLVGHSFGGRVGIHLASQTTIVDKLLLIDSAGININKFKKWLKIVNYKLLKFYSKINLIDKECLLNIGSADYKEIKSDELRNTFKKIISFDQTKQLAKIKCKTLIVWGENDKDTKIKIAKIIRKKVKNSAIIILDNAGHYSFLDKPNEFKKILINFIGE